MAQNPIRFSVPTSRAWARMKQILFQPFDAGKWFVLGFTAWLATLFEGGGSSGGGGGGSDSEDSDSGTGTSETSEADDGGIGLSKEDFDPEEVKEVVSEGIQTAMQWLQENPGIAILIGGLILLVFLFFTALFWFRCRGKFMFLDNVVHNRALVAFPWKEYSREGNSLFWWGISFGIVTGVLTVAFLGGAGWFAFSIIEGGGQIGGYVGFLVAAILLFLGYVLVLAYIAMLLEDFVIPTMHKYRLTTTQAWFRFLPVHNGSIFRFALYAIWKILLSIVSVLAIVVIGFGTCCVGFLLMLIPYIGAVVLLPMTTFFRSLGPEFLAQFGEEWDVFSPDSSSRFE
ncbi:MAG: hypothetical protein P1U87_05715 [Verrucomicrobiales bacterium]|nr:hypothetical protein [Verrucomicrobiales bacterium]